MFEHVSILLSFVFAVAITHLLTSVTELIWSRDRLRVSGLQFLWMFNALLVLLVNWIGIFYLATRPHWDVAEITQNFVGAVIQYFTCSLISLRPPETGVIDMPAFYARQRPYIFAAFMLMTAYNMFQNWWDSSSGPGNWFFSDLVVAPMLVFVGLAGWARAWWLQWFGGLAYTALSSYFLFTYALGVSA